MKQNPIRQVVFPILAALIWGTAFVAQDVCADFTRAEKLLAFNNPMMNLCVNGAFVLIIYLGSKLIITSQATAFDVGQLSSTFTYGFQILMSLMQLSMIFVMVTMAEESAHRINEVLHATPTIANPSQPATQVADGSIDFDNVSFKYSKNAERQALDSIDLHIKSGETIGVIGGTGAGKSSAATYLEDMGYYTVDNVPADIILKFAEFCAQSDGRYDRVALVSDIRSGNGNFQGILDAMERLKQGGDICRLLFVTADLETIIKRYKETRRRHPLMSDGMTIEQAMHREQELLRPLREHADFVIDTTLMPAAKLRNELYGLFGDKSARGKLSVNVVSFGFKYGIPLEADLVFDVRFLPNPFYVPELKHKTGMDSEVYDYVFSFPQTKTFIDKLEGMLSFLLPLYAEEGKSTLVIAVGCTGGHHRSVSVARCIASYLTALGYPAFENHRDITRG